MPVKLLMIVPYLPPVITGVGDYAIRTAKAVSELTAGRVTTKMVACGNAIQTNIDLPDAINLTGNCSPSRLVETILTQNPDRVIIHYSGYGYARRGAPLWLAQAIQMLRTEQPDLRLVTMFHELYAMGWPWQSSFWLSPVQRWLAAQLARLSDAMAATSLVAVQWLERVGLARGKKSVLLLPVCSNVGEPKSPLPLARRSQVAVIFGGGGSRRDLVQAGSEQILRVIKASGIDRIVQIGPGEQPLASDLGVECICTGALAADQVSQYLSDAVLGIVGYPSHCHTKSGVIAAYLAHGMPALVLDDTGHTGVLKPGHELVDWAPAVASGQLDWKVMQDIADAGFKWYTLHAHSFIHAQNFLRDL